jgi:tRNA(adenine34) deaminase
MTDEQYMWLALELARTAGRAGEIPVGAVVVCRNELVSFAHNRKERELDATAHAELLALRAAAKALGRWRLTGATLYTTLEPCPMCAGAMLNARLSRLVYAARDDKAGAAGSVIDLLRYPGLNHQVEITSGLLEAEASALLRAYFCRLRDTRGPAS